MWKIGWMNVSIGQLFLVSSKFAVSYWRREEIQHADSHVMGMCCVLFPCVCSRVQLSDVSVNLCVDFQSVTCIGAFPLPSSDITIHCLSPYMVVWRVMVTCKAMSWPSKKGVLHYFLEFLYAIMERFSTWFCTVCQWVSCMTGPIKLRHDKNLFVGTEQICASWVCVTYIKWLSRTFVLHICRVVCVEWVTFLVLPVCMGKTDFMSK